jgi:transcriptional regulator with GAF, ATPase, and Fis domain
VNQTIEHLIGTSPVINVVRAAVDAAAHSDANVLLTGERGTGKEIVARLIHRRSARSHTPLVTLNCAGVSEALLESELFGQVRAEGIGAARNRRGLVEMADGGTIFLDAICELSPRIQGLLLRCIESGEIQRAGSDRVASRVDVRLIAATSRNLADLVRTRAFREDLYTRLSEQEVEIPSLRTRRDDIPVLIDYLLRTYAEQQSVARPAIAPEAMRCLIEYVWPGNVRQLKDVVQRLMSRAQGATATVADLPAEISGKPQPPPVVPPGGTAAIEDLFYRMAQQRESFWAVVYPAFMARDLTRNDLRSIVGMGLQETAGSYKMLVELLNMQPTDYRRFLSFLRKHGCHVPFQRFRTIQSWHRDTPDAVFASAPVAHDTHRSSAHR